MQPVTILQGGHLFEYGKQADFLEIFDCCGGSAHVSLETGQADRGAEMYQ